MNYKEYRRKLTKELAESENKDYRKGIGFALAVLDDMIEYPTNIDLISSCKYPKDSRSHRFCISCNDKNMCKESIIAKPKNYCDIKGCSFEVRSICCGCKEKIEWEKKNS